MANHYSRDQWRVWFVEYDRSDLTVGKFCESIGVSVQTFYKWRRKVNDESEVGSGGSTTAEFVPITLASSQLEIELPCGAVVRVANDLNSIRPLVELLLELGANQ